MKISMVRLWFGFLLVFICHVSWSQTCTISGSGTINWSNASPPTCIQAPTPATAAGATVLIVPVGVNLVFDSNGDTWTGTRIEVYGTLSITFDVTINASLEVKSGGLVYIGKKLDLGTSATVPAGCNYTVVVRSGGTIDVDATGTDRLNICGKPMMKGNGGCNDCGGTNSGTCAYNGQPYCEPTSGFQGPLGYDQTGNNQTLPIKLKSFNAELVKDVVEIDWVTEEEKDFHHFEIQRAGSDFKFKSIIEEPGAGYNINSLQEYSAVDNNPLTGISYYRLKAVDIDGSYEYFAPKSVVNNKGRNLRVAPNPVAGNTIRYSINFEPGTYDRVVLIDPVGTELQSSIVTGTENEFVLDKSLKPGAYLLRYTSSTFQEVARVFVKN